MIRERGRGLLSESTDAATELRSMPWVPQGRAALQGGTQEVGARSAVGDPQEEDRGHSAKSLHRFVIS